MNELKFCKFCGNQIYIDAVMCPKCGRQIEELKTDESTPNPQIVINNSNSVNNSIYKGKECVLKNIPEEEAVERLIQLIMENGDWTDH